MRSFKTAISIFLALVMTIIVLPFSSRNLRAGTDYGVSLNEVNVTETNKNDILKDGKASYDPITKTLTLKDAICEVDNDDDESFAVCLMATDDITIKGTGSLLCGNGFGILTGGDVTIAEGSDIVVGGNIGIFTLGGDLIINGKLTCYGYDKDGSGFACGSGNDLIISGENACLLVYGDNGVIANGNLNVKSGTMLVELNNAASQSIAVVASYITYGDGIGVTEPKNAKYYHEDIAEYLCDSNFNYHIKKVEIKKTGKTQGYNYNVSSNGTFEDFIERLYNIALNRDSEKDGKEYWLKMVTTGQNTGADCARGFLFSPEFKDRGLSRDEFLDVLYKTFFKREADAAGKAYWMDLLAGGTSMETIIDSFINTREWCDICASYGVRSGAPTAKASFASENAKAFASRLYEKCLGREAEAEGLNFWALSLTNQENSGYEAAKLFFTSPEFVGLKTDNKEFVKRCYETFMGRPADDNGLKYWVGLLDNGTTREDVLKGFAQSPEFTDICNKYGILRGI